MKNTETCPKCNSTNCIEIENTFSKQSNAIKITTFTCALTTRYICCDCGYIEEWIYNLEDLQKIKNKYK